MSFGVLMIMQSCSLVPLAMVQSKLTELLPFMSRINSDEINSSEQVKLNYLFLFRKVLTSQDGADTDAETQQNNIQQFLPQILRTLASCKDQNTSKKVIVECILLLNELRSLYPAMVDN